MVKRFGAGVAHAKESNARRVAEDRIVQLKSQIPSSRYTSTTLRNCDNQGVAEAQMAAINRITGCSVIYDLHLNCWLNCRKSQLQVLGDASIYH
jgi:hypothetical protein